MRTAKLTLKLLLATLLVGCPLLSTELLAQEADIAVAFDVSPNVLNLANQGQVVTVHTDLPFALVDAETVTLNGVPISHWKSDLQGYFVAKFLMEDVKILPWVLNQENLITVLGVATDGRTFEGSQSILIVANSGGAARR